MPWGCSPGPARKPPGLLPVSRVHGGVRAPRRALRRMPPAPANRLFARSAHTKLRAGSGPAYVTGVMTALEKRT